MTRAETIAAAKRHRSEHGGTYLSALHHVVAQREADEWNAKHPIGTPVLVSPYYGCHADDKVTTVTRSEAWVVSGHASVLIEGKSGGYGLAWVKPIKVKAVSP